MKKMRKMKLSKTAKIITTIIISCYIVLSAIAPILFILGRNYYHGTAATTEHSMVVVDQTTGQEYPIDITYEDGHSYQVEVHTEVLRPDKPSDFTMDHPFLAGQATIWITIVTLALMFSAFIGAMLGIEFLHKFICKQIAKYRDNRSEY